MATWPPSIDDDGTGKSGTVLDDAFFDQIKAYVDAPPPHTFIDLTASTVWTTYEGAAIPLTTITNRYARLSVNPDNMGLIFWQVTINPWTLPAATGFVTVKQLPFQAINANDHYGIARSAVGAGYLTFGGGGAFFVGRMDGQTWPVGNGYVMWANVMSVGML